MALALETQRAREKVIQSLRKITFEVDKFPLLQECLARNKALDASRGCILTDAIVHIPLDTTDPIYVPQFKTAY